MVHNQQNVEVHHAGDAHRLEIHVTDSDGNSQNLTNSEVEWLLVEDPRDLENPELSKTGIEGEDESEITFDDPSNGDITVRIDTGDTDGLVDWSSLSADFEDFHHRVRITDEQGNRSTGFTGTFTLYP